VDSTATYTVILRDYDNVPIANVPVILDFSACDEVRFAAEQPFYPPEQANCPSPPLRLTTYTNFLGEARFIVLGSVLRRDSPWANTGCVQVWYPPCNQVLASVSVAAYDQDGVNGLTANDLFLLGCDWASQNIGQFHARSDLNGDGFVDNLDRGMWQSQYIQAHGTSRTPERCDGLPTSSPQAFVSDSPLRLAWNACASEGGLQTRTFACNTNTAGRALEASFVAPPGVERMTGFEAELWVVGNQGTVVPDWWHFDPDGCRWPLTGLSFDIGTCLPLEATITGCPVMDYLPSATVGRIRVVGALWGSEQQQELALVAGQEYSLFRLLVNSSHTVEPGSCAGCSEPVALIFRSLKLTQPPTASAACLAVGPAEVGDMILLRDHSTSEAVAFWQSPPMGWEVVDVPKADVPGAIRLWSTSPFRDVARVELGVPRPMHCKLTVYDLAGRRCSALLDEMIPAGTRILTWNGRGDDGRPLASGYYVMRLVTEDGPLSRPLIRVR
jgi:hypothetical protein